MTRRTRRRAQLAAAALAVAALYVNARWPDLAPGVVAYAESGAWRAPLAALVAVVSTLWLARRFRRRSPARPELTALYRWYDVEARLLYVGISNQPVRRTGQHADGQPWWLNVRSATVEWLPTRADAFAAEERAIKRENPEHNVIHARRRPAYARTNRGEN